jgi:hypothetical protein
VPVIPILRRLRQEVCGLKASLDYIVSLCIKKQNKTATAKGQRNTYSLKYEEKEFSSYAFIWWMKVCSYNDFFQIIQDSSGFNISPETINLLF